jgi:hypothetical protein
LHCKQCKDGFGVSSDGFGVPSDGFGVPSDGFGVSLNGFTPKGVQSDGQGPCSKGVPLDGFGASLNGPTPNGVPAGRMQGLRAPCQTIAMGESFTTGICNGSVSQ